MERVRDENYYPSLETVHGTTATEFALKTALANEVLEQVRQESRGEVIETPFGITAAYYDVFVLRSVSVLRPHSRLGQPVGYVLEPVNPDPNLSYEQRHLVDWVDFRQINEIPKEGDIVVVKKVGSFAGKLISVEVISDDYQQSQRCTIPTKLTFNDSRN